jgi:uncharacterized protein DUF3551
MRHALIGFVLLLAGAAYAQDYTSSQYCDPVCLEGRRGALDCSYRNLGQCLAARSGVGGSCIQNPFLYQCTRPLTGGRPRHRRR